MVQREVADRFFAEPGTKAYGAVSVLVRLRAVRTASTRSRGPSSARCRTSTRRSSPSSGSRRRRTPRESAGVVRGAFAHRRKTLANSLALAGVAGREKAVAALAAIDRRPDIRAEALAPEEFVALAAALAR